MPDRRVAVLVATFRRPELLSRLLSRLADEVAAVPAGFAVDVTVCDNDGTPTARETCQGAPIPVRYLHEPRPGIATARNRLLDAALDAELLAFIDDDEQPAAGWLAAIVDAADRYDADVVTGPIVYDFAEPPPPAVARSRPFTTGHGTSGERAPWPTTGNALIRRASLGSPPLRFDEAYGLTGGSDTMLFLRLEERGCRLVWCEEAVVHEAVPAQRATLRWVVRRAFRIANTHPFFDRDLHRPRRVLVVRAAKGAAWIGRGLARGAVGLARRDRTEAGLALEQMAWGAGMAAGAAGYRYTEYRRRR